jgi:hypothetical protein
MLKPITKARSLPAGNLAGYENTKEDVLTPAPLRSLETQSSQRKPFAQDSGGGTKISIQKITKEIEIPMEAVYQLIDKLTREEGIEKSAKNKNHVLGKMSVDILEFEGASAA